LLHLALIPSCVGPGAGFLTEVGVAVGGAVGQTYLPFLGLKVQSQGINSPVEVGMAVVFVVVTGAPFAMQA
jgi:hypothetical protein